jgi:hypothetical protein
VQGEDVRMILYRLVPLGVLLFIGRCLGRIF